MIQFISRLFSHTHSSLLPSPKKYAIQLFLNVYSSRDFKNSFWDFISLEKLTHILPLALQFILCTLMGAFGATVAVRTLNHKVGGSNPRCASCLCPWARHFTYSTVVSLHPGVEVGSWLVWMQNALITQPQHYGILPQGAEFVFYMCSIQWLG